jgi:hypothetical protein
VGTPDDNILSDTIYQAESDFELFTGSGFDQITYSLVQALTPFVDDQGWLHLFARERGPITAVTEIQVRDIWGQATAWTPYPFTTDNLILPSFSTSDTHPRPESWWVRIYPATGLPPRSTGQILVKWSYTGGFATIPNSLQLLIARMAAYVYKLREMPAGKVINQPLGTMTIPTDYPPDIMRQMRLWTPQYS